MKRNDIDMLHGELGWNLLRYAVPVMLTSYLQLLFNAADLVVVGRFCGSLSVAAVGSTGALTNLIVNLFMGLSVGAGVAVAHAIGTRDGTVVHRTVHTAILTSAIGGLILTVIGVSLSPVLLKMMDTPKDVLPLSERYMRIYFAGILFTSVYNFCTSVLRAAGDTKSPLVILLGAGAINVILNVIFVTALDMNVGGVALATVISQALSAAAVVLVLMKREDDCRLVLSRVRIYGPQFRKLLRIGIPAGVQGCMFSLSNVVIQSSINSFGPVVMSGNAAVNNLEGFCYVTVNAFHQTAVNYVGQNTGARQFGRVQKAFRQCILFAGLAGALAGTVFWLLRYQMLGIYITDSPEAIAAGAIRMTFTTLPYFVFGVMDVITGALRGLGASFISMVLSILGICGARLLWIYTVFQIPACHTPGMLYTSYILSWVLTLIAQGIAYAVTLCRLKGKE